MIHEVECPQCEGIILTGDTESYTTRGMDYYHPDCAVIADAERDERRAEARTMIERNTAPTDAFVWVGDLLQRVRLEDSLHPHYGCTMVNGHWYREVRGLGRVLVRDPQEIPPAWRQLEKGR